MAVRCGGRVSANLRLKVSGSSRTRKSDRKLVALVTVRPISENGAPSPAGGGLPVEDEQGFVAGDTDSQDGEPSDETELGAGDYDNARIADIALSELGRDRTTPGPIDHGQCKQSINDWVSAASGGTQRLGGGYHSVYRKQGGIAVGRDEAVKGDIIQLHNPANEKAYYKGMHTAVVLSHAAGSENFEVVDANYKLDGVVRRHDYNPFAAARKYGLVVTIWRMGSVTAPAPTNPANPSPANPAPTPKPTWREQQGSRGANSFSNPHNASGMGPRIEPNQWVEVSCKVYAPEIASVNPDGYWYRIASAPWNDGYYIAANTFWNGDVPGQKPYTHNTDWSVPTC